VARIRHCIAESALGVITGEVGTGKTVAARAARASLDPSRHALIYIANPAFGTRGLYVSVVRALGASPRFHKAEVMAQTSELLEAEEAERHRRVVIVVDEAHLLTPEQLEELRLLTNSDMDSRSPFAGILLGQPSLARQLRLGVFAALDQRIAVRYHIGPMDRCPEVGKGHEVRVAEGARGREEDLRGPGVAQVPGHLGGQGLVAARLDRPPGPCELSAWGSHARPKHDSPTSITHRARAGP
jgi:hypothetical protein